MIYEAKILSLNKDIEEEVTLQVGTVELTCFASYCPVAIRVGEVHKIKFHLMIFDEYNISLIPGTLPQSIDRLGAGYSYRITGILDGDTISSCGLSFEDEGIGHASLGMNGKQVALEIDRLDVEFMTE